MTTDRYQNASSWESLISMIDPLLKEDYSIVISRSEVKIPYYNGIVYRVTVMDNGVIVAQADSGILTEALGDVYTSTPERESR